MKAQNVRKKTVLILAAVIATSFCWGFFSHRLHVFPYSLLQWVLGKDSQPKHRLEIDSRSPAFNPLAGLPYVDGTVDTDTRDRGVRVNEEGAFQGYNLYSSPEDGVVLLIDNVGTVVHSWEPPKGYWLESQVAADGSLLVLSKEEGLIKLDKDSRLLWFYEARAHHDFAQDDQGRIYLLTRRAERRADLNTTMDSIVDEITVLDPDGTKLSATPLLDVVRNSEYSYLLPSVHHIEAPSWLRSGGGAELDLLHTNHVEVLDGRQADKSPMYAKGNLLISMRTLNSIAILEANTHRILWLWGPTNLTRQHHPSLLRNGNILIFDNGATVSRVVELDPSTGTIVWSYAPDDNFFTATSGSCQRLPNGNTLITESNKGYVHEVTQDGRLVWQFLHPFVREDGWRAAVWRMTRYPAKDLPFLAR